MIIRKLLILILLFLTNSIVHDVIAQSENDYYQLGLKQLDNGYFHKEKSLYYFNKSIKVDSNFAKAYVELGFSEYCINNYEKAFIDIDLGIKRMSLERDVVKFYYRGAIYLK